MGASRRAVLGVVLASGIAAAAFAADLPLRAARWTAGADPLAALTTRPTECLKAPADPDTLWSVEVGRAVFRSPTLLGGQAARSGVSCESCHRNGRGNPAFSFPGVSGAPGTADVTSAIFSSVRDDGKDNPKAIPDLAGIGRKTLNANMPKFLHGLVVEEFDGQEPPAVVMKGLHDYVQAMDPGSCGADRPQPVSLRADLQDALRAAAAAQGAVRRGDFETALVLVQATRQILGQVDERFAVVSSAARDDLRQTARDLGEVERHLRTGSTGADRALAQSISRIAVVGQALALDESRSLYDRATLQKALAR